MNTRHAAAGADRLGCALGAKWLAGQLAAAALPGQLVQEQQLAASAGGTPIAAALDLSHAVPGTEA